MADSGTNLQGEIPKEAFLGTLCGQTFDLDRSREGAGGPTIARLLSCACLFAMPVNAHPGPEREREREREIAISKKRQRRTGRPLFFHCTSRLCICRK